MNQEIKIRQLKKNDKESLMVLVRILYVNDNPNQIEIWDKGFSNYLNWAYVVEADKKVVGYISLGGNINNTLLIGDLCVLPEYRKEGIATSLIERAISIASKRGKDFVRVDTHKNNQDSLRIYKKLGFKITGETDKGLFILHKRLK